MLPKKGHDDERGRYGLNGGGHALIDDDELLWHDLLYGGVNEQGGVWLNDVCLNEQYAAEPADEAEYDIGHLRCFGLPIIVVVALPCLTKPCLPVEAFLLIIF